MGEITVYTKRGCPQCDATIRRLNQRGIPHEVVSLDGNPDAINQVKQLGHYQAPVIVAGVFSWAGYRPNLIDDLVEQKV